MGASGRMLAAMPLAKKSLLLQETSRGTRAEEGLGGAHIGMVAKTGRQRKAVSIKLIAKNVPARD
jgi:hypothetical protein